MQFDLDFSRRLSPETQIGMKAADDHANQKWKHIFDGCVLATARKKPEITSDDVLAEIEALPDPPDTHNLAAIGPAMIRAAKMGILQRSERPEKHSRQNIWLSNYFTKG